MKITPSTPLVGTNSNKHPAPTEAPKASATSATAELKSTVVRKALEESTDVDMAKVMQVRQAIAQGELSLDPKVLAEAVVGLHLK